jgi:type IV secretion system protein TrbL
MNDWIDLPIIQAMDYFQGVLVYFLTFAQTYGNFFGLIGLVWTSVRLINSRIDLRTAWWDSLSKWLIFIFLMNFYFAGTSFISYISNDIGINAGNGKTTIINNFVSLRTRIEAELGLQTKWANGLITLVEQELGIDIEPLKPGEDIEDYYSRSYQSLPKMDSQTKNKLKEYYKNRPDNENTIWGSQTLEALNNVLTTTSPDGNKKQNVTDAYVTEKPELNIWLRKNKDEASPYLSSSAIVRIGILTCQIIWEKAQMEIITDTNENGEVEYTVKKKKAITLSGINWEFVVAAIMAGILCIGIIVSVLFAMIQYTMCILEFIIVQGIGAGFIPFYLFDGTKDIPKKLIPVFTGFAIKMLVMVICVMFVINMYLTYTASQIEPTSGSIGWASFGEGLFIVLLSFILTSNAPKIAMTLLTGQPQLSMGEFVQAAGTMAGIGMGAANIAKTAASPAAALAKNKAHEWGEQKGAATTAKRQQENSMKTQFAKDHGIDMTTRQGQKNLDKKWNVYRNADERKGKIDEKIKTAGKNAKDEVKAQQKANFDKNGGVAGSAGRLLAHYAGAVANPKQTLMQGKSYNMPQSNVDIDRVGKDSKFDWTPTNNTPNDTNNKLKTETNETNTENKIKDGLPEDPNIGERQTE